jgi:hypothetical protein
MNFFTLPIMTMLVCSCMMGITVKFAMKEILSEINQYTKHYRTDEQP